MSLRCRILILFFFTNNVQQWIPNGSIGVWERDELLAGCQDDCCFCEIFGGNMWVGAAEPLVSGWDSQEEQRIRAVNQDA